MCFSISDALETTYRRAELPVPCLRQSVRPLGWTAQTPELLSRRHETVPVSRLSALVQGPLPATLENAHGRKTFRMRDMRTLFRSKIAVEGAHENPHRRAPGMSYYLHSLLFRKSLFHALYRKLIGLPVAKNSWSLTWHLWPWSVI